jgi:hypothetical protein
MSKGNQNTIIRRSTDHTIRDKTLHRKLKIKQHESHGLSSVVP